MEKSADIIYLQGGEKANLGKVRLVYTSATMQEALNRIRLLISIILTAQILILLLGIYFLIRRMVQQPVSSLAAMMERIAAGDLNTRLEQPSTDEIGLLALTANRMAGRMEETMTALRTSEERYHGPRIFM